MTKASQSKNFRIVSIGSATIKNVITLSIIAYFVYYFISPTRKPIRVYDLESCESACEKKYQNDVISCFEQLTKCTNECPYEDAECNDKCEDNFSKVCYSLIDNNELKCNDDCKAKYNN